MINHKTKILTVSNLGFVLLLIVALGDLMIPFFLAPFCRKYNHLTMVMSLLGNRNSPVHSVYSLWLVIAGILFILGGLKIYTVYSSVSSALSKILLFCIIFYAVGACILSGIFPVGETKTLTTLSEKIHGYGSAFGFSVLIFAPLVIGILSIRTNEYGYGILSFLFFISAVLFFTFFIMADKERFKDTVISYEGLWQRLSLLCMYAPLIMVSCKNIFTHPMIIS